MANGIFMEFKKQVTLHVKFGHLSWDFPFMGSLIMGFIYKISIVQIEWIYKFAITNV